MRYQRCKWCGAQFPVGDSTPEKRIKTRIQRLLLGMFMEVFAIVCLIVSIVTACRSEFYFAFQWALVAMLLAANAERLRRCRHGV